MNGKGLIATVIMTGVALGGLVLNGQRVTGRAVAELRSEVRSDIADVRSDIADLRERMARLEGLFDGHINGDCGD